MNDKKKADDIGILNEAGGANLSNGWKDVFRT